MPTGSPTASQVLEGEVSFFSIDTNLIQSAGYDFAAGLLHQLPAKLPVAMQLQLSEVVVREVVNHKMVPVLASLEQIESAARDIERVTSIETASVTAEASKLNIASKAEVLFRGIVESYAEKCRGAILPIDGEDLANEIFDRYFNSIAPFAEGKKKSEFPDAAILITLERYARSRKTMGIIASADKGAQSFANTSEHIYCVKSLEDLAALFITTDAHATKIRARIHSALDDENSALRAAIQSEIQQHLEDSTWTIDEIYSGTVHSIDADIYELELDDYEIQFKDFEIWQSEDDPAVWLFDLKINANVNVSIDVTFNAWDSIDHEEITIGNDSFHVLKNIGFGTYLACSGVTEDNDPEEWDISMDTSRATYSVDVGEVNPDFGDEPYDYE